MLLAACSGDDDPTPTATRAPSVNPTSTPTPVADADVGFTDLNLEVLGPVDGSAVETGTVRVIGTVRQDAVIAVNGVPTAVAADGTFVADVALGLGINEIEVVATDLTGNIASELLVVFGASPTVGIPLSLSYPSDGVVVREATLTVVGATRQDAIVGINGVPADVDAGGIFSAEISLVEGANLVEVIAADIAENVNYQTVVVFYQP
jgi:uncharacterized protein YfaP (DUF2135 family)